MIQVFLVLYKLFILMFPTYMCNNIVNIFLRYTFYDGPPFATGLPHYGHILAGTIKVSGEFHRIFFQFKII